MFEFVDKIWVEKGFSRVEADDWMKNGFKLEDAIAWNKEGFAVEGALEMVKQKLKPRKAKKLIVNEIKRNVEANIKNNKPYHIKIKDGLYSKQEILNMFKKEIIRTQRIFYFL